jgi:hypothetical protein
MRSLNAHLFDFAKEGPWEKAPPVDRELLHRFMQGQLPPEEVRRVIGLCSMWDTWRRAELEERMAYDGERMPPLDREAIRRWIRGELTGKEWVAVTIAVATWLPWADAHSEELAKLSRSQGNE